ncbi:MAG TPA: NAD-dependent deacylase [Polyangiaceae bacterium]|nr:NAD-dependent deacylase [Polyangiaceae bacterium]
MSAVLVEEHRRSLDRVASLLASARRVLFITGAGLSADSGLPTYRGLGGLYEKMSTPDGVPIESVLSGEMFRQKPELTWKYLLQVEQACRGATCNAAHRVLAQLERERGSVTVLTQNVDGFHQRAGSRNVIDIHGNLYGILCTRCRRKRQVSSYAGFPAVPRCSSCGGVERPDVVLFGENLPEEKLDWLMRELGVGFDLVISIGTSGTFPYIRLPMIRAQVYGWPSVDINPHSNPMTAYAEHHLPLRAATACEALWQRLQRQTGDAGGSKAC